MYFFDPTYFIFVLPAMLFAFYAQAAVSSAMARASRLPSSRGLSGREVAEGIVAPGGLGGVSVERTALGIAAHEAGHAVRHARGYTFLLVRNGLFPVVQFGSTLAFPIFIAGLIFASSSRLGLGLMDIGILLFFGAVVFQIITLPVEYNASARAVVALGELNLVTGEEAVQARCVLNTAALAQLLYLLTLRSRRE